MGTGTVTDGPSDTVGWGAAAKKPDAAAERACGSCNGCSVSGGRGVGDGESVSSRPENPRSQSPARLLSIEPSLPSLLHSRLLLLSSSLLLKPALS
jgi:hypothetical protein